tara:strand:- start:697 stop:1194 length:498 start_codon:yes stop_codon:yes gene_type:complete
MKRFLPLIFFSLVIILFFFSLSLKNTRVIPTPLIGKEVPLLALETVFSDKTEDDNLQSLINSSGTKLINFWASWCLPCEVEHPILMSLKKDSDIKIIGVNYKDKREDADLFLSNAGNPYHAILYDIDGSFGIEMGITGVPETFVVTDDGKIIYRHVGPLSSETRF